MSDDTPLTPAEQRAAQRAAWRNALAKAAAVTRNRRGKRPPPEISGYVKPPT